MIINDEIKSLIPPLTETEYSLLEQSILEEGCRDALITWNGTLLDGHNRYAICTKHNLPFKTQEMEFGSKAEAMAWIVRGGSMTRDELHFALRVNGLSGYSTIWGYVFRNEKLVISIYDNPDRVKFETAEGGYTLMKSLAEITPEFLTLILGRE